MATIVKIIFDRRKQSSKTQAGTVEIEVVSNGKRKRISTGIKVYQNEWNNGKIIKKDRCDSLKSPIRGEI